VGGIFAFSGTTSHTWPDNLGIGGHVNSSEHTTIDQTRRTFIKTATYVAPAILTLKAAPAFAQSGSPKDNCNNGVGNGIDCQPPGNPPINDGSGTAPGSPGNQGGVGN